MIHQKITNVILVLILISMWTSIYFIVKINVDIENHYYRALGSTILSQQAKIDKEKSEYRNQALKNIYNSLFSPSEKRIMEGKKEPELNEDVPGIPEYKGVRGGN